jgi:hypothetical protein
MHGIGGSEFRTSLLLPLTSSYHVDLRLSRGKIQENLKWSGDYDTGLLSCSHISFIIHLINICSRPSMELSTRHTMGSGAGGPSSHKA